MVKCKVKIQLHSAEFALARNAFSGTVVTNRVAFHPRQQ